MHISTISAVLWSATILVQAAALYFCRKQPVALYLGFVNLRSLTLLCVKSNPELYYAIYWTGQLIDVPMSFFLLHGFFRQMFQPYKFLPRNTLPNLLVSVSVITTGAIVLTNIDFRPVAAYPWLDALLTARKASAMVIAALLLVFLFSSNRLGIPIRHRITLAAYTYFCALSIGTSAAWAKFPQLIPSLSYIDRIAWLFMLVVWCCARSQHKPRYASMYQIETLKKKTHGMSLHLKDLTNHERIAHAVRHRSSRTA